MIGWGRGMSAQRASKVDKAVTDVLPEAVGFLADIIRFPSIEGAERDVQERTARALNELGMVVALEPIPESIRSDAEFTPGSAKSFSGRNNVVARAHGSGGGRSLILNTHSDVVGAPGWDEAFKPTDREGFLWGRGAVDAKGQIATIYLALLAIRKLGVHVAGDIEVQIVIDEEVGGNGTLALLRSGHRADAAVVLEPTSLKLHPANRGALWFRFTVNGEAAHMARKFEAASAVDYSMELVSILYRFEKELLERARTNELFSSYKNPVQINIGKLTAGEWPATVAARAVIEGGVGFLPDTTIGEVKKGLMERVDREGSGWLRANYKLEFPGLHNDAFMTAHDAPVVKCFQASLANAGCDAGLSGWIASCDARLMSKVAGLDTVVFGPGDLSLAHSERERIDLAEMEEAAATLVRFIIDWCK
jgi:acetylornithine deacetylase